LLSLLFQKHVLDMYVLFPEDNVKFLTCEISDMCFVL
jgi:hypothetical protein